MSRPRSKTRRAIRERSRSRIGSLARRRRLEVGDRFVRVPKRSFVNREKDDDGRQHDLPDDSIDRPSRNLWWTWHPEVVAIFRDVEPALWREVNHNPIAFVKRLTLEQWSRHAEETVIEIRVNRAFRRLEEYLRESGTWASRFCNVLNAQPVAYFSAEFALYESLPTYSGGLGVLAGDHLKSCSDLGVPLVGVGIFYGQGYFRQGFDINGWQREGYGHIDVEQLPLSRVTAADGRRRLFAPDERGRSGDAIDALVAARSVFRERIVAGAPLRYSGFS